MTDVDRASAAIDAANADDPNRLGSEPLAQVQGRMADSWTTRLDPQASAAVRIAARAHHLRRWTLPREAYPDGRAGYLRWRREQKSRHAADLAALLTPLGIDGAVIERATVIVQKRGLGTDPEVQLFEDAVCLTFLETQFVTTADKVADDDRMVEIVAKTLTKMSATGRAAASAIALDPRSASIVERAMAAPAAG